MGRFFEDAARGVLIAPEGKKEGLPDLSSGALRLPRGLPARSRPRGRPQVHRIAPGNVEIHSCPPWPHAGLGGCEQAGERAAPRDSGPVLTRKIPFP